MYLFFSLNIYLFGKKMLDSFIQKQSQKQNKTKESQTLVNCKDLE